MKLKYEFVVNEVADKFVAVPMGEGAEELNGFIKMNDVGAAIFECLKNGTDEEEIIKVLLSKFEGTKEEARECYKSFTDKLNDAGVLE